MTLQKGLSRFFRNARGLARFTGPDGQVRKVMFGLAPGSSDVIGWQQVVVTKEMVGARVALFTAIELKRGTDSLSKEQGNFLIAVAEAGGIAGVCGDEHGAAALVAECVRVIQLGGTAPPVGQAMH